MCTPNRLRASTGPVTVSVLMITYNHERYISQALDSALRQETDFKYEIVVGEDCSTDGTRDVVTLFAKEHPDKIRAVFHPHNLGANGNIVTTLRLCKGQYIAYLDGDDYWTSSHKLQRQVQFLDHHPECAICFHNAIFLGSKETPPRELVAPDQKMITTIEDLVKGNYIPNVTVMFRNGLVRDFPEWFFSCRTGDWVLHVMQAQYGKIGYLSDVMAVYRVHAGGIWSALSRAELLEDEIKAFRYMNKYFGYRYKRIIEDSLTIRWRELARAYAADGDLRRAKYYVMKSMKARFIEMRKWDRPLFGLSLQIYAPWLYGMWRELGTRSVHKWECGGHL